MFNREKKSVRFEKEAEVPREETQPENNKKTETKRPLLPYIDVPPMTRVSRPTNTSSDEKKEEKPVPAYRTRAPVEDSADGNKMVDDILDMSISVPLKHLVGSAPHIREALRKNFTKTRQAVLMEEILEDDHETEMCSKGHEELPLYHEIETGLAVEQLPVSQFLLAKDCPSLSNLPADAIVASDPYYQFALEHNGAVPKEPYRDRARNAESLREIQVQINNVGFENAILDSGSQIVSMSQQVAVEMGLSWNPSLSINMQSANNQLERTLGIAENVKIMVGGIVVYLQIHIVRNPPYRVLLGKPFDTVTTSVVKTMTDGYVEVLLTDPNSKRRVVIPTYARGKGPIELQKEKFEEKVVELPPKSPDDPF